MQKSSLHLLLSVVHYSLSVSTDPKVLCLAADLQLKFTKQEFFFLFVIQLSMHEFESPGECVKIILSIDKQKKKEKFFFVLL